MDKIRQNSIQIHKDRAPVDGQIWHRNAIAALEAAEALDSHTDIVDMANHNVKTVRIERLVKERREAAEKAAR